MKKVVDGKTIHVCDWCNNELPKDKEGNYLAVKLTSRTTGKVSVYCSMECALAPQLSTIGGA